MKKSVTVQMLVAVCALCFLSLNAYSQGVLIPTGEEQGDFMKVYKFVLSKASVDYRFTNATMDTTLFPKWGEFSIYWVKSGPNQGSFVYPDRLPYYYSSMTSSPYSKYDWQSEDHYAISFKAYSKAVAIFKSNIRSNRNSISWEAVYFKNIFESFLLNYIYYYIDEKDIDSTGINWATQLLIIPSFSVQGTDWRANIDSVFASSPRLKENLIKFLSRGGTIYTEGNAVYVVEKLGLLAPGAVDYNQGFTSDPVTGSVALDVAASGNPLSFTQDAAGNTIYATTVPRVNTGGAEVIARLQGTDVPVVFVLKGASAYNGRVICNTALPAVGGSNSIQSGKMTPESRQVQWVLNSIMYAFARSVDVTRSVYNDLPDTLTAGRNAVSYDRRDTLEIRVKVRNLSSSTVNNVEIKEYIRGYFTFVDVKTTGVTSSYKKPYLKLSGISIPAHSEKVIVYRIATPAPDDPIHEKVNKYISWKTYMYASISITSYTDDEGFTTYRKYRNYVDIMFSARIVADTDLNWKNFLGLYYQPFKVFMIMENKERTSAMGTKYVQYIPKDIPFYWTDKSLNIPILKTPGGKYVDVLRGSTDENNPEYDMDHDGHPDAWLDTASIYPKNYTIEETSVYWLNPWEHLRSGNTTYYEDIDHDGKRAQDLDGDGVVDVEEPGDKIRVWKVTWDVGKVGGYQFFDPYCYYEIWVDPPDLVPMSAGVGRAYGKLDKDVGGMFYPYSPDLNNPDLTDTSWTHWMERDKNGNIIWKQLIYQKIHNYEGFTFIDTAKSNYKLKPTDRCAGTVPQPHREFIAVLSLGGEEIDMNNPTPKKSLYSNIEYTTIFNEKRNTPIRTTYTYYAPLPNPLQFEYLSNNFLITDAADENVLQFLPARGKANLTFEIDASTEYTYYWIRNVGYDVDYNDPSFAQEGVDELGDGVFGYMMYDIPKGMGGYKITLPKKPDGSYDIDKIVQVDGHSYRKWIDNPNTRDSVIILEDPFTYHVFIPQVLIPPALDDDNSDGIDDWIDDRGDRFMSKTGFLHDAFMLGNGEDHLDYPKEPFKDDIYGWVTKGWYGGEDGTYGDDYFEKLGKTHFTIKAQYQGLGREGSVDISKGGWLVVEEIFGGSPWVIFSHSLSGYAEGVNYSLTSSVNPTVARYGLDTVYVKHVVRDIGEPHSFDINFDPYRVSYGYGDMTITTFAGGRDPCSLIDPEVRLSTIIDPTFDRKQLTLVPHADTTNPDLKGYPKTVTGNFIEVLVEVSNGTDYNWVNSTVTPVIPKELGNTKLVMSYVAYPRPLVPAKVDPATGKVIHKGDDLGTFTTGWRFNQPEGEVLVKMGNTLNLLQPTRRAYFVFLFSVDEYLPKGIYGINFSISGDMRMHNGAFIDNIDVGVPPCMFSISTRDAKGNVVEYQKLVIGQGDLQSIDTRMVSPNFKGLGNVRWSPKDINYTSFDTLANTLTAVYDPATGVETIDLSPFRKFPTVDLNRLYLLEKGQVTSFYATEKITLTKDENLNYTYDPFGSFTKSQKALSISTVGPKVILFKKVVDVNGQTFALGNIPEFSPGEEKDINVMFEVSNQGNSIADNVVLDIDCGPYFYPIAEKLPSNTRLKKKAVEVSYGSMLPGETRRVYVHFGVRDAACRVVYDTASVVSQMEAAYDGTFSKAGKSENARFTVPDYEMLYLLAYDFQLEKLTGSQEEVRRGQTITLSAKCANGIVPAAGVPVAFYVVIDNRDTVLIGERTLSSFNAFDKAIVAMDYTIPDTASYVEFFAKIDPGNRYGEFCEYNNVASVQMPLLGLDWMLDVVNYPNPVTNETRISYLLPRDVKALKLYIYSLDSKEIEVYENLPGSMGRHSITWYVPNAATGTYFYRFEGFDNMGKRRRYIGKMTIVK